MRPYEEVRTALGFLADGASVGEVARLTGIPRSTVRNWRQGARTRRLSDDHNFSTLPPAEYSYLFGMYLGDGYLARHRREVWRLRISMDAVYPRIIDECCRAMEAVMPGQRVYRLARTSRCIEVSMYSKHWPCLFPQHGPGRKHERPIRLESWQASLVCRETERFVRGLMHSDGCRVITNDRGVRSVRYHFSNRSEDIKRLLCASLDRLGIPWTRPSDRQIAVYRKDAVARLDRFIGQKE